MKARRTGGATFSVASFYRTTWQLLIILTGMLAIFAQVVRPWVALPAFAISFFLVTPFGLALGPKRRLVSVVVTTLLLGLALEQVLRIHRLEDFIQGMIEMICGALALLLLRPSHPRTYWLGILTVVIIAVGSISLTSSPLVYGLFLLQTGCVLLNLNAAQLYMQERQGRPTEPLPSGYLMQFLLVMPLGTVSALLIFLAFPRVSSFTMALTQSLAGHRTGYSGLVSLSGGGELQESKALAFMVESDDRSWLEANAGALLFRGDALDAFDGQRWTNSVFNFRGAAATDLRLAKQHARDIHLLTVHLEPSPLATIFYPEILLGVTPLQPSSLHMLVNGNGSLSRDVYTMERVTYDLRTVQELDDADLPPTPLAEVRRQLEAQAPGDGEADSLATLTPGEVRSYLDVPAAVRDAPYFKAWLREVAIDPGKVDVATLQRRLTQLFTSKFTPTLANTFTQHDALAAFLGEQREGHCEYFATSTVLTLRALGVPARVVVGYFGGTFNDLVGALEVRDDDAHAWVEAYVPGVGWHTFNPTPPVPREPATSLAAMLRLYANATSFWLRRYLVDYDQSTQRSLLHSLQELAPKGESSSDLKWPWAQQYGRSLGLLLCLGVLFWWLGQLWRSQRAPLELPRYYRKFMARQVRAGRPRFTGETFAAYHRRLRSVMPDPGELDTLDERLQLDLYAPVQAAMPVQPAGGPPGTDIE